MLTAVRFPRYTGTAPGTTTVSFQGAEYPPYPPPDGGPGVPPYPTQAWLVPQPSGSDEIRIAVPPNQQVTGPREVIMRVPAAQKTMGPHPNDAQLAPMYNYLPVHRGWIHGKERDIFTLGRPTVTFQQAANGEAGNGRLAATEKWAIAGAVMSGLALLTTAVVAVLRYRDEKNGR